MNCTLVDPTIQYFAQFLLLFSAPLDLLQVSSVRYLDHRAVVERAKRAERVANVPLASLAPLPPGGPYNERTRLGASLLLPRSLIV